MAGQPDARADLYREDLEREGWSDGCHGFSVEVSDSLRDGRHHCVEIRSRGGQVIAAREAVQIVPKLTPVEFDRRAPWIDADDAGFERELARLQQEGDVNGETGSRLRFFREHGWLKLEQAVPHALSTNCWRTWSRPGMTCRRSWCSATC